MAEARTERRPAPVSSAQQSRNMINEATKIMDPRQARKQLRALERDTVVLKNHTPDTYAYFFMGEQLGRALFNQRQRMMTMYTPEKVIATLSRVQALLTHINKETAEICAESNVEYKSPLRDPANQAPASTTVEEGDGRGKRAAAKAS